MEQPNTFPIQPAITRQVHVLVTPEMAQDLLLRNIANRTVKPKTVNQYAEDMLAGRWSYNCGQILISDDNRLIDGQHRLLAVIRSECPQYFDIVTGLAYEDAIDTVDAGVPRTASDALHMKGVKNARNHATVCRHLYRLQHGYMKTRNDKLSHRMIESISAGNPGIQSSLHAVRDYHTHACPVSHAVLATMHYTLSRINDLYATEFIREVITGQASPGAPTLAVRNRLAQCKFKRIHVRQEQQFAMLIRAWNLYIRDQSVKSMLLPTIERLGESFPTIDRVE